MTGNTEKSKGKAAARSEAKHSTMAVEFTLGDDTPGDYFDIELARDPVYGTPVYKTVAGRSSK